MSRWINADALIAETKMDIEDDGLQEKMVFYRINEAPSIDIVRCGECKRANHELSGVYCGISDVLMGEDGFCSIGEREGE